MQYNIHHIFHTNILRHAAMFSLSTRFLYIQIPRDVKTNTALPKLLFTIVAVVVIFFVNFFAFH